MRPLRTDGPPARLLVLDIETIPDRHRLPPDHGARFPKPMFHRIACISYVEATITVDVEGCENYAVTACRSGGEPDWDERRLLTEFWRYFERRPTRVCGWNSRSFDMPVILQRSLLHQLSAEPWFRSSARTAGYGYRYSGEWHCDLMDLIADHGASAKLGLDEAAVACGLPGKMVSHGSEVESLVSQDRIQEVRDYCEIDTLNTFVLYLRYALLTGRTSRVGHEAALDSLTSYLDRERAVRSHLGAFRDQCAGMTSSGDTSQFASLPPQVTPSSLTGCWKKDARNY